MVVCEKLNPYNEVVASTPTRSNSYYEGTTALTLSSFLIIVGQNPLVTPLYQQPHQLTQEIY
jgi:hypothetical protein